MLLPSDVARLVLGYLQEEGLSATSQAFIHESPNLKEYADHTIGDVTIPACVLSVFGKGLTTILNEYVAAKTKESRPEIPPVMTSLWKKLDFTLNQIKALQNCPSMSTPCQRTRSRIGVANMARQRVLTMASAGAVVCSSFSETSSIMSPAQTTNSMPIHSTPANYAVLPIRPADTPMQVTVTEQRQNLGPMSPGRRKWDTPRKRGGAVSGSSGPGRCATTASSLSADLQPEEAVDENFPQLVIQNARDKILGDRSLQEKLAENINKILASDPMPQTSKASSNPVEADQSIDEILGLQGEIHMSDDAIHDILEQTESDPAFQALYDLFDYNKNKFTDGDPVDVIVSSCPVESDAAGPSPAVRPLQSDDPGSTHTDGNALDTQTKTRTGQERKTRKSTAPTLVKKTIIVPRSCRVANSTARLIVNHGEHRGVSSAAAKSNRKEKAPSLNSKVFETPMDLDEPLNTPPPPSDSMATQEPASKDCTPTTTLFSESSSSRPSAAFALPEATSATAVDKKQAQGSKAQPSTVPSSILSNPPAFLSPVQVELNNTSMLTADLPQMSISSSGDTQPVFTVLVTSESASSTSTSTAAPFATPPVSLPSASTSVTRNASPASSTPASSAAAGSTPDRPATNQTAQSKTAADSNIVSLKIIVSDDQEDSSTDQALTQAISTISGDKIPTIYLSSPAKSPGGSCASKANLDEVAQAVSGLQSSEILGSPLSNKSAALLASPLTGTSQAQQNYIIQLPLDTTAPGLQGATASYFIVTDPTTTDAQTRQVLLSPGVPKGQPLPANQFAVTTPTRSQGFSTGPAINLTSPVKPMMLPVSVVGQNTLGKVQMMSNQLVAIPNAVILQQPETVNPKVPISRLAPTAGAEQKLVGKVVQPASQDTAKGPKHKRILCFESSAEAQKQTAKTTKATLPPATDTSTSQSAQQTKKDDTRPVTRTRPNILGGNKPKRRIQTVRCSTDPQTEGGPVKESEKLVPPEQQQKDSVKNNSSIRNQESQSASTSSAEASQRETVKKSDSGKKSKSTDSKNGHGKDGDGAKAKDANSSRTLSSDSAPKSGTEKEGEESSKKEPAEKAPAKSRDGRPEKKTPAQEMPNVTANKENEIKGSMQEQQQQSTPSSSASRDFSPPAVNAPTSNPQAKATKAPSKTSSLAKQAAEMLQGLNSPSTPVKKPAAGSSDLPRTPGTVRGQEETPDCPRTPSRQKKGKDGEGTPKNLMPPNTPDVPTCSPASEAGSENSINMAAHTLMILSRAAIARTGTPLKDSLRQEGVGEKSPSSSKNAQKRKPSSPAASPPAKKDRERKKLLDCFPHDLDVDKFLSSLHYDE